MLAFLQRQEGIESTQKDTVGFGSFTLDSGIYPAKISKAYLQHSGSSKAVAMVLEFELPENKKHKETIWLTNGDGNNYYLDKKTNKPIYLPGFETVSNIAFVAANKELSECTPEDKIVEIYNSELKKNAPTTVKMFMELVGKELIIGIQKVIEFKQAKNQLTGKYEDTLETKELNEIVNVFNTTGFTALELKSGATEIDFINKFKEVYNAEYVRDKTKGKAKAGGVTAPAQANPSAAPKLFGGN